MKKGGFTLVEIMVVVAIIAILSVISIPNLLRSRLTANESAAESNLKTIALACESFRSVQPTPAYPAVAGDLTGATPAYVNAVIFDAAGRQGYVFTYTQISNSEFVACGTPVSYQATGERTFAVDESGVLRFQDFGASQNVTTKIVYNAMTVVD
ncbi:MAG: type II secretion system protein [Candidatus Omnitrophica bacterium]|nr:type II secretion system protein [Candidatus Omnitrophota bacterium]